MARKGLGKGLDALFAHNTDVSVITAPEGENVVELKLTEVEPDVGQPRTRFDDEKLAELAASIAEHGVITPIIVNKQENGFYRIVAGERRWRASKIAGAKTIPAIVRDMEKEELYQMSLVENLQRQDLNPIEEAKGYKRLMDDYGMTQEQISKKLGKSRSSVANSLRILNLPDKVIDYVQEGRLTFGHAKVLLSCDDEKRLIAAAEKAVAEELSVRALESELSSKPTPVKNPKKEDINVKLAFKELEQKITNYFSTKVRISGNQKKGKIEIEYYGTEDLERIVKLLNTSEKTTS